jgi:tetratricopeptide (TPR) repeat protein
MFDMTGTDLLANARRQILAKEYSSALRSFQRALADMAFEGETAVQPQFLSHYGVALAMAAGKRDEGRRLCERSIQLEPYEPEHFLNLARIHQSAGNRRAAFGAFDRGLAISPEHPQLLQERTAMDRRRPLALPSLHRDHPLNRCLSRLLALPGLRSRS